jgi:hypothetical protein
MPASVTTRRRIAGAIGESNRRNPTHRQRNREEQHGRDALGYRGDIGSEKRLIMRRLYLIARSLPGWLQPAAGERA